LLNPHYKDMGNLYGSQYWTYLLPQRVGAENAKRPTQARLPMGAAKDIASASLIESCRNGGLDGRLIEKRRRREQDEADKPLDAYRSEELARLYLISLASIQATTWHATHPQSAKVAYTIDFGPPPIPAAQTPIGIRQP
jgi:hypothetical protein